MLYGLWRYDETIYRRPGFSFRIIAFVHSHRVCVRRIIAFVTGSRLNVINSAQFNVAVHNYCGIIIP